MKRNFDAMIFDLDGTLIDSIPDIADSMNRVLTRHGHPEHTCDQYRDRLGQGLKVLTEICVPEHHRSSEHLETVYQHMVADYSLNCVNKTSVYSGIHELLARLSAMGIKTAVLSNKADTITRKIVGQMFRSSDFNFVMGASERFPRKPSPEAALYVAEQIGVLPHRIFYLGDTGIDMQTARSAQCFPAGASWGFRPKKELIDSGARFIARNPGDCLMFF
jgi:phosphoglycolate phosphatase